MHNIRMIGFKMRPLMQCERSSALPSVVTAR